MDNQEKTVEERKRHRHPRRVLVIFEGVNPKKNLKEGHEGDTTL